MENVLFTSGDGVPGICIAKFACDQSGNIIESDIDAFLQHAPNTFTTSNSHKAFPDSVTHQILGRKAESRDHGDAESEMIQKLHALVRDAKEAFSSVMSRNVELEREILHMRQESQRILDMSTSNSARPSSGQSSGRVVVPPLVLPLQSVANAFDISTPPVFVEGGRFIGQQPPFASDNSARSNISRSFQSSGDYSSKSKRGFLTVQHR